MKYKNTDMSMVGTNISTWDPKVMVRNSTVWNDKNKYVPSSSYSLLF